RHNVIELRLDDEACGQIQRVWEKLERAGITSVMPDAGGRAHVSLVVGTDADTDELIRAVRTVCVSRAALQLHFPYLGLFRGPSHVGFLGVAHEPGLSALQKAVYRAAAPHLRTVHEHYRPEVCVFHCTLGLEIPDQRLLEYFQIVKDARLPTAAAVAAIDVVEYFPAQTLATIRIPYETHGA
ncbi:MAG: 2'-5' RNA ligase family protein, partial [Gammaproteobacteria bacterium]